MWILGQQQQSQGTFILNYQDVQSQIFMTDIQALLSALEVFNGAPDKTAIERANSWLQDFQHSVNCLSPVANVSTKHL